MVLPFPIPQGTSSFDPAATALFARMSPAPTWRRKLYINRLIVSLKRAGVWAKTDILYLLAADASANALLNWKGLSPVSALANMGAAFTTDQGFKGDGSSTSIQVNYGPPTSLFAAASHHLGVWVRTAPSLSDRALSGVEDGASHSVAIRLTPAATVSFRDSTATDTASASMTGHLALSRTNSSDFSGYQNGSSLGTFTHAYTNPNLNLALLANNNNGTLDRYSDAQICAYHAGGGLTSTEMAAAYAAMYEYLHAISAV